MYGHGAPPPTRSASTVITLRVLFAAAGFLSCGLLACLPLFRVAFLRGRWFNWTAAWMSLPMAIVCFAVVGSVKESDHRGDVALALVLLLGALASAYYLTVDIRLHNGHRAYAGYAPPGASTVPSGAYGYPQTPPPYAVTQPAPQPYIPRPPAHQTPVPGTPGAQGPVPPHPHGPLPPQQPQRPAPARIDQVRAELDELSDYLRRQDGGHEGGR
ncbi:hypothetical protein GCM10010503_01450 [Streptomyces lucensis JCM 4490]|uniref:Integral membrane protein n=1 Tax=Streptomyces lucensis JCM 4490 TaxID=1306176 RepID=A0A918ISN0_9ACTN|nr:hypothetical protein [Streptomyces lucensis]GGW29700.1 hypothetical protein GCM10010503_01450 [Streptomyces lucensis JCM 4490]